MILDEIATLLVANGHGVLGTNLFKGIMPDTPDLCTAIYEYSAAPPNLGFGVLGIADESPGLQIVTRAAPWDYSASRSRLWPIFLLLAQQQAKTLSGTQYWMVHPQQSPFVLERDIKNRVKFAVNFLVEKKLSAA